ncbi:MAG: cobalamin B12-binding domain-containing protein [Dehalococcoidia bacterium]|nr:cobalamin B12-binding domain-containing protein [Dehalococcoidia bacterium]
MSRNSKPRILLVKHWIDIHDRGLRLIAARCKDAGFEVVYASYSQPEEVVKMAVQEDVDVIGMSFFTSAYEAHLPKVMKGLKENNMNNVMVVLGGVIPDEDYDMLKSSGVREIYGAGSDINQFIELVKNEAGKPA